MEKDPVCGIEVDPRNIAGQSAYMGRLYSFCSISCKEKFDRRPARYADKAEKEK